MRDSLSVVTAYLVASEIRSGNAERDDPLALAVPPPLPPLVEFPLLDPLRPVVIDGNTSRPFGDRPITSTEFRKLKEEGRLAEVLQLTRDKIGDAWLSNTLDLALELCKMDCGLNGPNRHDILMIAENLIAGGYLSHMQMAGGNGNAIVKALEDEHRLIPALKRYIESYEQSKSNQFGTSGIVISAKILLLGAVHRLEGVNDRNTEQLRGLALELIDVGCYEAIPTEVLDLPSESDVLKRLAAIPGALRPSTVAGFHLNNELKRRKLPSYTQLVQERSVSERNARITASGHGTELLQALEQLTNKPSDLTDLQRATLQCHHNCGLAILALRSQANGSVIRHFAEQLAYQERFDEARYLVENHVESGWQGIEKQSARLKIGQFEDRYRALHKESARPRAVALALNDILGSAESNLRTVLEAKAFDFLNPKVISAHRSEILRLIEPLVDGDSTQYYRMCQEHLASLAV